MLIEREHSIAREDKDGSGVGIEVMEKSPGLSWRGSGKVRREEENLAAACGPSATLAMP
jgi:hypothetical protein